MSLNLYEEAVARQWSSARDIPWCELKPAPDDLECAMVSYGIGKSDSTEMGVLTLEQFPLTA